jgi:peptide deformylase
LDILTYPNPKLTTICKDTTIEEAKSIITALEEALTSQNGELIGLGLSANQIGINSRVCIIRCENHRLDLVNPIITWYNPNITEEEEGCLSYPDNWVRVRRSETITVKADNFEGSIRMNNPLVARVVQHELEHLDGFGIWNYVGMKRNMRCFCGSGKKYKKCHGKAHG